MNYRYNYSFLKEWWEANALPKATILQALSTQDFRSLDAWLNGDRAIPMGLLLRLCNAFSIPLAQFFFDLDGASTFVLRTPVDGDKTDPTNGYRKPGDMGRRQLVNPQPDKTEATRMPDRFPFIEAQSGERIFICQPKDIYDNRTSVGNTKETVSPNPSPMPATATTMPPATMANNTAAALAAEKERTNMEVMRKELEWQQKLFDAQRENRDREDKLRSESKDDLRQQREQLTAIMEQQKSLMEQQKTLLDQQHELIDQQTDIISKLQAHLAQARKKDSYYPDANLVSENNSRQHESKAL